MTAAEVLAGLTEGDRVKIKRHPTDPERLAVLRPWTTGNGVALGVRLEWLDAAGVHGGISSFVVAGNEAEWDGKLFRVESAVSADASS